MIFLSPTCNFLLPCGGVEYMLCHLTSAFPGFFYTFLLHPTPSCSPVTPFWAVCLLPEPWSKERREGFPEYFALPTLQGEAWEAKIPLSCLPWQHQPADDGDWIPNGHPAVIKSERQQLAEFHSAQLEMAPDLGYSCPGHLGNLPSLFLLQTVT